MRHDRRFHSMPSMCPRTIEEVCISHTQLFQHQKEGKSDTANSSLVLRLEYWVGYVGHPGRNLQIAGKSKKAIRHTLVPIRNIHDLNMRPRDVSSASEV